MDDNNCWITMWWGHNWVKLGWEPCRAEQYGENYELRINVVWSTWESCKFTLRLRSNTVGHMIVGGKDGMSY